MDAGKDSCHVRPIVGLKQAHVPDNNRTLHTKPVEALVSATSRVLLEASAARVKHSSHPSASMSPTCTLPYEILFEFMNDTTHSATMQVLRHDDGTRAGATILLHPGEVISLVLTAGQPYKYSIRQHGKEALLSYASFSSPGGQQRF